MTEKQKPAPAPKAWRGKPAKRPVDPHYGEMREPTVPYRPNLTMRIGSAFYDWLRGRR